MMHKDVIEKYTRCETEQHAQELYEQFLEQGLDVKIVT